MILEEEKEELLAELFSYQLKNFKLNTMSVKQFDVKKVSRTEMTIVIHSTKGRIFNSTHVGIDGKAHSINGIRSAIQDNQLGYIKVHSVKKREPRLINPQTLTSVTFKGVSYQLKK
jgi:hypothetical protein